MTVSQLGKIGSNRYKLALEVMHVACDKEREMVSRDSHRQTPLIAVGAHGWGVIKEEERGKEGFGGRSTKTDAHNLAESTPHHSDMHRRNDTSKVVEYLKRTLPQQ